MTDRGVSTAVNYVVVLTIVSLLGSGLFVTAADYVQAEQSAAMRDALEDVGNDLAADLGAADRLARAAESDGTVTLHSDLPDRVAGSTYRIEIRATGETRYELVLRTTDPETTVTVPVRSRTPVVEGTVEGGSLVVRAETRDGTRQPIEVAHD